MKNILLTFIFLSFFSCKKNTDNSDKTLVDNSIKTEELTSFEKELIDSVIFKKPTIIPLETNNKSLLGEIDRIIINKDRIYIYDRGLQKICIFDKAGKSIHQIHSIGEGPEEYISSMDFCLDKKNNEILLLCDVPYKLMRFSIDGKFISNAPFSNLRREIVSDADDNLYCSLFSKEYEIGCFDKNMKLENSKLLAMKDISETCYNSGKALVSNKNLTFTRRFDPHIYYLSKDQIEKKYELNFGKYKIPEELQHENDCKKLFDTASENKYIFSITNVVESTKYILCQTNIGNCIYEKATNKLKGYEMLLNKDLIFGTSYFHPNNDDGNSITIVMSPSSLAYYSENTLKEKPLINDLVKKVKSDDNPILIVYEFK